MNHSGSIPSGTVTFLFTDIEGAGYVFKTVGDAFCAAFSAASEAVSASLDIQRTLQSRAWQVPGGIRVRIALHVGEAESRDNDYFGPTVNRVARLLGATHGGQTLLSLATAELVKDTLPDGASLLTLGSHRLKDLSLPLQVYQLLHLDLTSEFPALVTPDNRLNNLLPQPTELIGREKELGGILDLIKRGNVRLLTLTGTGGTGKTRLAVQVAAEMVEAAEHGVFFVDLSVTNEPEQVISIMAQALDVREGMGESRPLVDILKDYLKRKEMLLLLDNFEQVLAAGTFVAEILASCPELKIIVTSREPLHVRGEREFPVPPLSLPSRSDSQSVEKLTQYESVRLFVDRAVAVKSEFKVTNETAPAVAEICIRLDGLPLAIELAAARTKILPPQTLMERLTDRLRLLKGGARDLPARQQTLRGAIDWSYDLLDEGEKNLFARLSVFSGGCTLEAAEEVCAIGGEWEFDVIDGLASLVDKSLVRQSVTGGEPRFWMLETVGEYARDKLEESGYGHTIRGNHAEFFLDLAEEVDPKLRGPDQMKWFDCLETELTARAAGTIEERYKPDECEEAVGLFRQAGDLWGISRALHSIGTEYLINNEYGKARSLYEQSIIGAREAKDRQLMLNCYLRLSQVCMHEKTYRKAAEYQKDALQIAFDLKTVRLISYLIHMLGQTARGENMQGKAARLFSAHETIAKAYGTPNENVESSYYSENFPAEWAQGLTMNLEQAVEYALEDAE